MLRGLFGAIMAGGGSALESLLLALHNVVPAALAGIGVVHVFTRSRGAATAGSRSWASTGSPSSSRWRGAA